MEESFPFSIYCITIVELLVYFSKSFFIIAIIIVCYNQTVAYLLEGVVEIQKFGVVQIVHDGDFIFDHVPAKKVETAV